VCRWHASLLAPRSGPSPSFGTGSACGAGIMIERDRQESEFHVYAIVRAGGRQEKVSVGDVIVVDRLSGEPGTTVQLRPLMLVDGDQVTATSGALAGVTVTAEIVAAAKGPKIRILKFKNKTGYKKRQGHRQKLTRIKVTGIEK
jgi:large subunit ribosomal protein L21